MHSGLTLLMGPSTDLVQLFHQEFKVAIGAGFSIFFQPSRKVPVNNIDLYSSVATTLLSLQVMLHLSHNLYSCAGAS